VSRSSSGTVAGSQSESRESGLWSGRLVIVDGWCERSKLIVGFDEYRRKRLIDSGLDGWGSSGTGGNGTHAYGDPTCLMGGGVSRGEGGGVRCIA
jgi:hypothetical protein